ncbi:hypothetical protein RvY_15544 [Ramazzottius varieornatus]|uniref:Uncharacterized protein n=1 Tax=Ramazzottius varieornatus TaxID=947166 RepID=A0A1D1VYI3_RAMVA|nr:hypothetical protein RvY_15544 [Ramazzottius varieornatus]
MPSDVSPANQLFECSIDPKRCKNDRESLRKLVAPEYGIEMHEQRMLLSVKIEGRKRS